MGDKLMSRDQVKTYINANTGRFGADDAVNFARQLYDAMGENEQLRKRINEMETHEFTLAGFMIEKPNKQSGAKSALMEIGEALFKQTPSDSGMLKAIDSIEKPSQNRECVHLTTDIYGICPQCGHKVR